MAVPELLDVGIEAVHVTAAGVRSRNVGHPVDPQAHQHAIGRRVEKGVELPFRRLEGRVRHVIDEADVEAVGV